MIRDVQNWDRRAYLKRRRNLRAALSSPEELMRLYHHDLEVERMKERARLAEERARQGRQPPPPLQQLLKNDEMVSSGTFWHSLFHNNPSSSAGKTKEAMLARVIPGFAPAPPPGADAFLTPAEVEAYNAQGFLAVEEPLLSPEEAARHGDLWQAIRDAHIRDSIGPMNPRITPILMVCAEAAAGISDAASATIINFVRVRISLLVE